LLFLLNQQFHLESLPFFLKTQINIISLMLPVSISDPVSGVGGHAHIAEKILGLPPGMLDLLVLKLPLNGLIGVKLVFKRELGLDLAVKLLFLELFEEVLLIV